MRVLLIALLAAISYAQTAAAVTFDPCIGNANIPPVLCPPCHSCSNGQCFPDPTRDGEVCDDGSFATYDDVCNNGICDGERSADCVGSWVDKDECSVGCGRGDGEQRQEYIISIEAAGYYSMDCPHNDGATQEITCNLGACPNPIKRSVVKRLFKVVPRMVERTKGNIARVVKRMLNAVDETGTNYDDDEVEIIRKIDRNVKIEDDANAFQSVINGMIELSAIYDEDGTPSTSRNNDNLDEGQVRNLLRILGKNHQVGYKAHLNRLMQEIIAIRVHEDLDYRLKDEIETDLRTYTEKESEAKTWLPMAYSLYHELKDKYTDDGTLKSKWVY